MKRRVLLPESVRRRIDEVVAGSGLTGQDRLDVTDELEAHFEDGLAAGRTEAELLDSFGDPEAAAALIARTRRRARPDEARSGTRPWWQSTVRDVRYALRRFRQSPGFVLTVLLSLAVGIGGNTAIFTLVNAVLMRDRPYAEPDALYDLYLKVGDEEYGVFSYPDFRDVRDNTSGVASQVVGTLLNLVQVEGDGGEVGDVRPAEMVSGEYFSGLGIKAVVGRTLLPTDDVAVGAHPVVMLGYNYWQQAFAGDPDAVGQTIRLNGRPYTIIGVAPAEFPGSIRGLVPDVFAPILMLPALSSSSADVFESRGNHSMFVKVRLADGVTPQQLETTLAGLASDLHASGAWQGDRSFQIVPTKDVVMYPPVDRFLKAASWMLMAVVGMVLLIACANLASLLLARAIDRRREVAVRLALGGTRGLLVRQMLTESVLLAVVAGGIGVMVSVGLLKVLVNADLPIPIPISIDLAPDATVLLFSLGVSLLAGLAFGFAPALRATRASVAAVLRDESPGGGGRGRVTLRGTLVAVQVAVSLVLLVTAGLLLRSFLATQNVDPGLGYHPAALVAVALPSDQSNETARQVTDRLLDRVRAMPGVVQVGVAGRLHLDPLNTWNQPINVDGIDPPPGLPGYEVDWTPVSPELLDVLGIRIVEGRGFTEMDRSDGDPVVIINETLARRFFPDQDPLGRIVRAWDSTALTVVGVARDAKVRSLGEAPRAQFYRPLAQAFTNSYALVARTDGDAERLAIEVAQVIQETEPTAVTWEPKSLERHIGTQLIARQLGAGVVSAFAGLALLLAVVGLYGVVNYAASQRRHEVGIRMSLGAGNGAIVRLLLGSGLRMVGAGVVVGWLAAFGIARMLSGLLYGVEPFDPVTFAGVPLLLLTVAVIAAWLPARRATKVDPVSALRSE